MLNYQRVFIYISSLHILFVRSLPNFAGAILVVQPPDLAAGPHEDHGICWLKPSFSSCHKKLAAENRSLRRRLLAEEVELQERRLSMG